VTRSRMPSFCTPAWACNMTPRITLKGNGSPRALVPSLALLAACLVVVAVVDPQFLTTRAVADFLRSNLPIILIAVGQTIIVIGGGIDLSLGAILTLSSVVMVTLLTEATTTSGIFTALFVGVIVGGGAGLLNGIVITTVRLQPVIATFAMSFIWGGLALWVFPRPGGQVPDALMVLVRQNPLLPFGLWVIGTICGVWWWASQTRFIRHLLAAGGNQTSAFSSGISIDRVRVLSHGVAGLVTGIGSLFLIADIGTGDPLIGAPLILPSVVALIIGGTRLSGGRGSVVGTIVGVVVLGLFRQIVFYLDLPSDWQPFADGVLIICALAWPGAIALFSPRWRVKT
jgi:ribose transport system permease protein